MSAAGEANGALRSGVVSAMFGAGSLRDVYVGNELALLQVYVAVRDANWETIPGRLGDLHIEHRPDGFTVTFRSVHAWGDVSFSWDATIEGRSGTVTFAMDGVAGADFAANRIGFCLLHPLTLAGAPVTIRTVAGERQMRFPTDISAHQPFPEMAGMAHALGAGKRLDLAFDGELFETEDQRNWTDASYKTYCTPLRLPYPRQVSAGERIRQAVTLTGHTPGGMRPQRRPTASTTAIRIDDAANLPPLPRLGLGAHSQGEPLDTEEARQVGRLRPDHLRVWIDPRQPQWPESLDSAAAEARALGVPLDVDALSHDQGSDLETVAGHLGMLAGTVRRLYVFDVGTWTTGEQVARHVRHLLERAGLAVALGGGSTANFADLNRTVLPLALLDVVTYAINPQVHAFDERSIMETLEGQTATVNSARRLAGGLPLVVGPVTLRPRFNPVATGIQAPPPPGELPPTVDPRQAAAFTAAWTVGSVAALASAQELTYFETAGWRGLFARRDPALAHPGFPAAPGSVFPVHRALAGLAAMSGRPRFATEGGNGRLAAIAVADTGGVEVLLANLTPEEMPARISAGDHSATTHLGGYGTTLLRLSPVRKSDPPAAGRL
ncbi:MAG: hypothetical protein ACRDT6_17510 [Micromonosporaceae bacterium]